MSDFCYSFPVFNRVLSQADLMDQVLVKAGIDPLDLIRHDHGAAWYEARTRCIDCMHATACRDRVASPPRQNQSPPDYCPNSAFFAQSGGLPALPP